MEIGDVAGWLAVFVALGGVFFAGWQLKLLREQHDREREVEKSGVAVMWRVLDAPTVPDKDGTTAASYEFTAYNPGKLPVREVEVSVDCPVDVRREHFDRSLDSPTRTLVFDTPVIAGGQHRVWNRRLRVGSDDRPGMRDIQVSISFMDLEGTPHSNSWGRRTRPATDSPSPSPAA